MPLRFLRLACFTLTMATMASGCSLTRGQQQRLYQLSPGVSVYFEKNDEQEWGLRLERNGAAFLANATPITIEILGPGEAIRTLGAGYDSFRSGDGAFIARGSLQYDGARFVVHDTWSMEAGALRLDRKLEVEGNAAGGFMSAITLSYHKAATRDSVKLFAPGMIYGTTDHLPPAAIGGRDSTDFIRIREDRLPAPLFGANFDDGTSLTLLNSEPDARTTREDSHDLHARTLIDERFRFGAIGADFDEENPAFGYWFPGSEGATTYKGHTYPAGEMATRKVRAWARRYHPIDDGLEHEYQLSFRFGSHDAFNSYYTETWRWAWSTLQPKLVFHDVDAIRRVVLDMLGAAGQTHGAISGIPFGSPATKGVAPGRYAPITLMGFTGKTLEAANFLLADALLDDNPRREKHRALGESIVATFMQLNMSPPEGEGYTFATGETATRRGWNRLYLRVLCDGHKELLKAIRRERRAGINHEDWLEWSRSFGDWLLLQQDERGGFPRYWEPGTGRVIDASTNSSYNAILYLVLLSELTGDNRYGEAALKTGEFSWNISQPDGVFTGGTIDNPDVIDKEAGTLSLEGYLALFSYTSDREWLERAMAAANFAETWIYIWDVPMPDDEDDSDLHWKKNVSTVGTQLISTGHSLNDQYMAFDVSEFAELYLNTGDEHYFDVAMILLHNTKSMLAIPGREFDLKGPGWQQEHWSLAPPRGYGVVRMWVPWISTSHLNGILELQELDEELYQRMTNSEARKTSEGA